MTKHNTLPVWLKIALRELRGGLKGFRIFMACLILGVMAIATVGSLTNAIKQGITNESQSMLGGDVEIRMFRSDITAEQKTWISQGATVSSSARMRTMARTETGASTLVELRAVDTLYPLYGSLETDPMLPIKELTAQKNGRYGVAVEAALAERLGLKVGDDLKVGSLNLDLRAIISKEPDKANLGFQLGPSIMVSHEALQASGLLSEGTLIDRFYKVQLPKETNALTWMRSLENAFPDARIGVRSHHNAAPGLRRFIERMSMFLTLVGLTALVVGGVGVGNAVKGYMNKKIKTIATLKILGASGETIFLVYFSQIILLALVSIIIGITLGAFMPDILMLLLPDSVPIDSSVFDLKSLWLAAIYGLFVTVAFTAWPLGLARDLPAVRLFRDLVSTDKRKPQTIYKVMTYTAIILIILLAIGLADNLSLASGFVGGALASLVLLRGTGRLIEKVAAKYPRPKNALRRLALANIHRPGSSTGAVVLSLGLGLTLFVGLSLIEGNLEQELESQVPKKAPAFFFLDIQANDIDAFKTVALSVDGTTDLRAVPSLRGRVTAINGTNPEELTIAQNVRWVARGDRGLSYSSTVPEDSPLVEGDWWPENYTGQPEISLGLEAAEGMGVKIGDTITMNVMGREITARIRNLRAINWGTLNFNFVIMFDPYTLKAAPHTYMATIRASEAAEEKAYGLLTKNFPTVTVIRTKEIIEKGSVLLEQIGVAIRATGLIAIIAGIFVLSGAIAAGFKERVYDAVIMKIVGAVKRQILNAYILEYLIIGSITAGIALILGGAVGFVVIKYVMDMPFTLLPSTMIYTVIASLGITLIFGLLSSIKALGVRPNAVLRNE